MVARSDSINTKQLMIGTNPNNVRDSPKAKLGDSGFEKGTNSPPPRTKMSFFDMIKEFFRNSVNGISNGASKFTAMMGQGLPPIIFDQRQMGPGQEPQSDTSNGNMETKAADGQQKRNATLANGVSTGDFKYNLKLLDEMTESAEKLPDDVRKRFAQSPTLMKHMEGLSNSGFTLDVTTTTKTEKIPNGDTSYGAPGTTTMSLETIASNPVEFIGNAAEKLLEEKQNKSPNVDLLTKHMQNLKTDTAKINGELNNVKSTDTKNDDAPVEVETLARNELTEEESAQLQ